MKIKPLSGRIVIKPEAVEETANFGIVLPAKDDNNKMYKQGKIVTVAKDVGLKRGDRVLFVSYGVVEVKVDGKEYIIAKEDDILAILE